MISQQKKGMKKCQETTFDLYTTGNVLDCLYHQKYKLIGIDLPRKKNTSSLQQSNFNRKLEEDD